MFRRFGWMAALVLGLALVACGDDEPTSTPTTGGADATADVSDAGSGTPDATVEPGEDATVSDGLVDPTFRLTFVNIRRPIGGIGDVLENLIAQDIDADLLHVLIQFRDFDTALGAQEFTITGTAGDRALDEAGEFLGYKWYPGVEPVESDYAPATLDAGLTFENTENLSIIFPTLEPGAVEPLQIPVSELALAGTLEQNDDGSWYLIGTLSGAILAAEVEGLDVNISGEPDGPKQPLSSLLGSFDYPRDAEQDARTGWSLEAEIEAEPITFVPTP